MPCTCNACTRAGPLFSQLGALRAFIRELRPQLGSAGTTAALTACDELQALGQLLLDWGVARDQLLLEPLLTPQAEYFSGCLFQVCLNTAAVFGVTRSKRLHVCWLACQRARTHAKGALLCRVYIGFRVQVQDMCRDTAVCFDPSLTQQGVVRAQCRLPTRPHNPLWCVLRACWLVRMLVPAGAAAVPLAPRVPCAAHLCCCCWWALRCAAQEPLVTSSSRTHAGAWSRCVGWCLAMCNAGGLYCCRLSTYGFLLAAQYTQAPAVLVLIKQAV